MSVALTAGIPRLIEYQGRLTDDSGVPVADGDDFIRFNIYDGPGAGATQLWTSNIQQLTVTGGFVTYILGSNGALPASVFEDSVRYLGIKVGTDPEMTERLRMVAVPYAYKANSADTIANDSYVLTSGAVFSGAVNFDFNDDGQSEVVVSGSAAGGILALSDGGPAATMILNGGGVGDQSVQLPDGSITVGEFEETQVPVSQVFQLFPTTTSVSGFDLVALDSFTVSAPNSGRVIVRLRGAAVGFAVATGSSSVSSVVTVSLCTRTDAVGCDGSTEQFVSQDADNVDGRLDLELFTLSLLLDFPAAGSQKVYFLMGGDDSFPASLNTYPLVELSYVPATSIELSDYPSKTSRASERPQLPTAH